MLSDAIDQIGCHLRYPLSYLLFETNQQMGWEVFQLVMVVIELQPEVWPDEQAKIWLFSLPF